VISCADQEGFVPIRDGLAVLSRLRSIYWHNGIKFDFPALRESLRLRAMDAREKMRDTFVIAGMRWAHIKDDDFKRASAKKFPKQLAGSHSLKAWGFRLGILKGDFKYNDDGALDHWTPELQEQCVQDTAVTKALVLKIRQAGVSNEAVEIEHALAWYLAAQERNGVPFDMEKAISLQAKLSARREEIELQMQREFGPLYREEWPACHTEARQQEAGHRRWRTVSEDQVGGVQPQLTSSHRDEAQAVVRLEPTSSLTTAQPKIDEKTLKGLNAEIPAVKLLLEFLLVEKRLGQLVEGKEAWMRLATKDGPEGGKITGLFHIHGRVKQNEAITHRAAHSKPNMSAVPRLGSRLGKSAESCSSSCDGWVLVGADASGLELRCLAHYMAKYDGGAYGKTILEGSNEDGTDIHSVNMRALGSRRKEGARHREDVHLRLPVRRWRRKAWLHSRPVAVACRDEEARREEAKAVPRQSSGARASHRRREARGRKGWLRTLDGRRVYVRSDHAALNTLLQCAGAIICKRWICNFSQRLEAEFGPQGWRGQWAAVLMES
jgi:DNA polymerase-1